MAPIDPEQRTAFRGGIHSETGVGLYPFCSVYALRSIRRLRYGRGFGVHSPKAFWLVNEVVRPRYRYYDEPLLRGWYAEADRSVHALLSLPELLLWYRLCARLAPQAVAYACDDALYPLVRRVGSRAEGRVQPVRVSGSVLPEGCLLLADDPALLEALGTVAVLVPGVRRSRACFDRMRQAVQRLSSGIVLDLGEALLYYRMEAVRYLYRSSL